jgi:phage terminase large subunit GpA-like protein
MNQNPCPKCGEETHETDYALQKELRRKHYEEGKHLQYICNDCGGTIRGWWDI